LGYSNPRKFLSEDEYDIPINSFDEISDALASTIMKSSYNCIGIYGEWGTGKTTLMRSIERKLNKNIIQWDELSLDPRKLSHLLNQMFQDQVEFGLDLEFKKDLDIQIPKFETSKKGNNLIIKYRGNEIKLKYELEIKSKIYHSIKKILFLVTLKITNERIRNALKLNELVEYFYIRFFKLFRRSFGLYLNLSADKIDVGESNKNIKTFKLNRFCYIRDDKVTVNLQESKNVTTIFFNTWKYEREEEKALVPLLKNIFYALEKNSEFADLKRILVRSIKHMSHKTPNSNLILNFLRGIKYSHDYEKDTIYYDGLTKLEDILNRTLHNREYTKSKIVIFIDDLDRCSPEIITELFESFKILLDMSFITFVVGINDRVIRKHIEKKYRDLGFQNSDDISKYVSQYFDKIFQLKYSVPFWDNNTIQELVDHIHESYEDDVGIKQIIIARKEWLSIIANYNPRVLKNFLRLFHFSCDLSQEFEFIEVSEALNYFH